MNYDVILPGNLAGHDAIPVGPCDTNITRKEGTGPYSLAEKSVQTPDEKI